MSVSDKMTKKFLFVILENLFKFWKYQKFQNNFLMIVIETKKSCDSTNVFFLIFKVRIYL
jgi:hypothetical protein